MAFQGAAKKDQARLRRPTAGITGDGIEDLNDEQKLANLVAVEVRQRVMLTATKGARLPVQKTERALLVEQWENTKTEITRVKGLVAVERKRRHDATIEKAQIKKLERIRAAAQARPLTDFIIDVARETITEKLGESAWAGVIAEAKRRKEV